MPAAAMRTPQQAARTITPHTNMQPMLMRRMIIRRTIMAIIIIIITTMTITLMSIAVTPIITAIPMLMTTSKPPPKPRQRAVVRADAIDQTEGRAETGESRDGMKAGEAAVLYRLMTWLSPSFPVGAFSHSSGIEWAVEAGDIGDAASLGEWLASMLADGPGFCDGVFLAHAHRAASSGDDVALCNIAELASAFVPSRERHLETSAQGRAFIEIARAAWNCGDLDHMVSCCDGAIVYPVALGLVSAAHKIPLAPTMHGFLHALTSNWISAGARLVPLGQTDSQRVLALLEPVVVSTAKRARDASLDELGSATFRADLASMRHETQYTRLFRS
jgi:urease accessory protein